MRKETKKGFAWWRKQQRSDSQQKGKGKQKRKSEMEGKRKMNKKKKRRTKGEPMETKKIQGSSQAFFWGVPSIYMVGSLPVQHRLDLWRELRNQAPHQLWGKRGPDSNVSKDRGHSAPCPWTYNCILTSRLILECICKQQCMAAAAHSITYWPYPFCPCARIVLPWVNILSWEQKYDNDTVRYRCIGYWTSSTSICY